MFYLIDIGSSTIKVYKRLKEDVELLNAKTFNFKDGFSAENGLSQDKRAALLAYFHQLIVQYGMNRSNTKLYATGIFRDIPDKRSFIWDFYVQTHLFFNILSHDLEAFYLQKAWLGKCSCEEPLVVINIGGKTTELVFYQDHTVLHTLKLPIGVGTILTEYPSINKEYSDISLNEVVAVIKERLMEVNYPIHTAIYTGGELRYMRLAGYPLKENNIFSDKKHPFTISFRDYAIRNEQVFSELKLSELRNLMPENPNWMDGARTCSAIAQAICEFYSIETIIPSDSNLIDGVNIQETRTVAICGSFNKHLDRIATLIKQLNRENITVLSPRNTSIVGSENDFVLFKDDSMINNCTWSVELLHMRAIEKADLILVCNFNDYVGKATSMEIGYALNCAKRIVFVEDNHTAQEYDIPSEIHLMHAGLSDCKENIFTP